MSYNLQQRQRENQDFLESLSFFEWIVFLWSLLFVCVIGFPVIPIALVLDLVMGSSYHITQSQSKFFNHLLDPWSEIEAVDKELWQNQFIEDGGFYGPAKFQNIRMVDYSWEQQDIEVEFPLRSMFSDIEDKSDYYYYKIDNVLRRNTSQYGDSYFGMIKQPSPKQRETLDYFNAFNPEASFENITSTKCCRIPLTEIEERFGIGEYNYTDFSIIFDPNRYVFLNSITFKDDGTIERQYTELRGPKYNFVIDRPQLSTKYFKVDRNEPYFKYEIAAKNDYPRFNGWGIFLQQVYGASKTSQPIFVNDMSQKSVYKLIETYGESAVRVKVSTICIFISLIYF